MTLEQHSFELLGSLICRFLLLNMVLQDLWLVESPNATVVWRANSEVILEFSTTRMVDSPNPHMAQGSTVF